MKAQPKAKTLSKALLPLVLLASPALAQRMDGVALQAGDNVITVSVLFRRQRDLIRSNSVTTREDIARLQQELVNYLIESSLEAQAGEDLGIDPTAIRLQAEIMEEQMRDQIGATAYGASLFDKGISAIEQQETREAAILSDLWRRSQLGFGVADLRPKNDRYIRPGELYYQYRANRDYLNPPTLRFQILIVSTSAAGSPEAAEETCLLARERILAGEEFSALVDEFGAAFRETGGETPDLTLDRIGDPLMLQLAEGEVGGLSEVAPTLGPNGPAPEQGFRLVRLSKKELAPPPDFADREVQVRLRNFLLRERDNRLLDIERNRLRRQAYLWQNPYL